MIHLQHELVEDAIRRRQIAMHAADPHAPAFDAKHLEQLENQAFTAIAITALRCLRGDGDYELLCEVLEQLVSEVAGARDAVEHERALRRMT